MNNDNIANLQDLVQTKLKQNDASIQLQLQLTINIIININGTFYRTRIIIQ